MYKSNPQVDSFEKKSGLPQKANRNPCCELSNCFPCPRCNPSKLLWSIDHGVDIWRSIRDPKRLALFILRHVFSPNLPKTA